MFIHKYHKTILIIFLTGLFEVSCSFFNQAPPGQLIENIMDRSEISANSAIVKPPAQIMMSEHGGIRKFEFSLQPQSGHHDRFLITRNHQSAVRLYVNDALLESFGSFPPTPFFQVGKYLLFRIPGDLLDTRAISKINLEYYTDSPLLKIEPIYEINKETANYYSNFVNLLNTEIYRYFAFLCFFIFIYSLVQFIQRPSDLNSLFFALFNLFIGAYFFGIGLSWVGLPFLIFLNIFKGCLFIAVSALLLFCISFSGRRMKLAAILISVIGVALFGFMVFASHNSYQTNYNFRIALVLGSLMMITAFVYIIALYFQGLREIRPLLIGGLFGLIAALCDVASLLSTQYTLFWVQGFGIFIFLISVFLSMAGRTTRMHRELEGYMKGIQVEVERRTGQLNDSNVALSRASKAKSDFLAHMSHEIRTPLNSIMGFAQILEQRNQSEIDRYYIGLILKESDHLMQLISQILDLSRIEQGKLILDSENFHLKSAFNSVVEGLSQSAAQKGLLLEVCLADELPEFVTGDLLRFQQILINILGNSIKFTQTGKIRLEARAIAIKSSQDQIIEISVIDTGIGITNDKLETIFNRFEQGDNSITRKYGGTGLGLTIARDLVHLMGGEIHISSTPNVCTRVNLTVRFVKSEQLVETKSSSDVQQVTQWHPPQNCQVLVVDDYASNLEVVRIFLSKAGIQMIGAQSGKDALEIFRQEGHTINAILMDIHMPEMDGWETTRRIKELDNGANCPVIALTADAFKETAQNCQKFGIQDILTKPLHYETLIATLAHNLAAHQSPFTKPPRNFDTLILNNNIIDYRHLSESYFGDEEIINQLLVLFVDSGASLLTELQDALEDYQIGIIHLKAHAIKGGALNVGAVKIALSASHLEQLAKKHADPHVLKKDFKVLEQDWKDFVYELTRSGFIKS